MEESVIYEAIRVGRERTGSIKGPHTPASLAREPGSTRLEMDQIRQCMDNKEPSRVKFRRAEPDPPLLAVRLGSARLEHQFASVWRITDRTRAPTTEKSVHSVFTTVGQTLRTTRSAKAATFFEKTHVCNWASKIRRCMVNNQRVRLASEARRARLASQTRRCMGPLTGDIENRRNKEQLIYYQVCVSHKIMSLSINCILNTFCGRKRMGPPASTWATRYLNTLTKSNHLISHNHLTPEWMTVIVRLEVVVPINPPDASDSDN
ncbi:hypothetical protein J6590_099042 [Homalodisca vitripennis]|nr:hypothetical protein J6590_099042 [Homalodisca vitripennis]